MKKVSLILTTYNSKDNLEKTLSSIEIQDYPEIEVVIKDGQSTDGTLDVIEEYQRDSKYAVIWDTRPDNGIYDAMNQGYALTSGDVIVFFNDQFTEPWVVRKMMELLGENPDCVGIHADLEYKDGDKIIRTWQMGESSIYHGWMPGHPTLFLRRGVYEQYGLYRTDMRISADYELMIRFLRDKKNRLAYLPETIVSMFYGGTSSGGLSNYLLSLKEGHQALILNGINHLQAAYIDVRRMIKVLRQFRR